MDDADVHTKTMLPTRKTAPRPAGNRTTRRPDRSKEKQIEVVSGHVSRSPGLAKTTLQGTGKGGRRQGRERKRWEYNIKEWTGPEFAKSKRAVKKQKN